MTDANAETLAARLRGFGPTGVLAIAAILLSIVYGALQVPVFTHSVVA